MIKLNNNVVEFSHFNDGASHFFCLPTDNSIITWLYENDEEIIQLYYLIGHLKTHHSYVELNMPYVNSARQDRAPNKEDVFTLKYFCNLINSLNIDKIRIFDPHSSVAAALLNNVEVISPKNVIQDLITTLPKDLLIAYPDFGAEKRYSSLLKKPYVAGAKARDWFNGMIYSLKFYNTREEIEGHSILMIDDIVSRGSTLAEASRQLKELGANNIYVYVSHCENTVLKPNIGGYSLLDIPDLITKLYTTNSIFTMVHPKIKIIHYF